MAVPLGEVTNLNTATDKFGISLCNLGVLCVSVVSFGRELVHHRDTENTEVAQRNPELPKDVAV
jgi:hypothetical protein